MNSAALAGTVEDYSNEMLQREYVLHLLPSRMANDLDYLEMVSGMARKNEPKSMHTTANARAISSDGTWSP